MMKKEEFFSQLPKKLESFSLEKFEFIEENYCVISPNSAIITRSHLGHSSC